MTSSWLQRQVPSRLARPWLLHAKTLGTPPVSLHSLARTQTEEAAPYTHGTNGHSSSCVTPGQQFCHSPMSSGSGPMGAPHAPCHKPGRTWFCELTNGLLVCGSNGWK